MSDPTNGELALMIENVTTHLVDIKTQTTKTNGRVTVLEKWMWVVSGGALVVGAMVIPIFRDIIGKYLAK